MLHVSSTFGWPCYISIFGISSDGVTSTSPVIIFPWGITQPTGRWTLGHGTGNFTLVEIDVTEEANSLIF